jgi:hypothetical protein
MSDNLLYFISIIARALQSSEVERALSDAFYEIKKKGSQNNYAKGYLNFELFMQEVYNRYKVIVTDHTRELIAVLGTGMFEGSIQEKELLSNVINSTPEWKSEYEAICRGQAKENRLQDVVMIGVLNDKGLVSEKTFEKVPGITVFEGILPGRYKIKLVNTGWIIWEGELTAKTLIWFQANKDANLPLAAGTATPTDEIDLLNSGALILRTYAGIESGRIEIELRR